MDDRSQVFLTFDTPFTGDAGSAGGTFDTDAGPVDIDSVTGSDGTDAVIIVQGPGSALAGGTLELTSLDDLPWNDGKTLTLPQSVVMTDAEAGRPLLTGPAHDLTDRSPPLAGAPI